MFDTLEELCREPGYESATWCICLGTKVVLRTLSETGLIYVRFCLTDVYYQQKITFAK